MRGGGSRLAERLRGRRGEIEQAVLTRVYAIGDPHGVEDPDYPLDLREAVGVALDYGIDAIEGGSEMRLPVPPKLLAQARAAFRNGVSVDIVLRRYVAGCSLLADFIVLEAAAGGAGTELREPLRVLSAIVDRLSAAVADAYAREAESRFTTPRRRRAEKVRRLLAGELLDDADLDYELEAWHLAAIGSGPGAIDGLRALAAAFDRSLLLVRPAPKEVWAWLGGRLRVSSDDVLRGAEQSLPAEARLAFGEPGRGVGGWRLSHRQAGAARAVSRRGGERKLRYVDFALLASALRDELLASSLDGIYLTPLEEERDGGFTLRRTLAAYFAAGQNVSATAAGLGLSRKTVNTQLRAAERRIGLALYACAAPLETALRLHALADKDGRAAEA